VRGTAVAALLGRGRDAARLALQLSEIGAPRESREARLLEYELVRRDGIDRLLFRGRSTCETALDEGDPIVRSHGVTACVLHGEPTSAWLEDAARDTSWAVRTRLATALAERRPRPEIANSRIVLERLARDPHLTVRAAASLALRRAHLDEPSARRGPQDDTP
jgi:hypothetical protein